MIQFAWKFKQVTCLEFQLTEKLHTFLDTLANNWLVTEAGSTFKPRPSYLSITQFINIGHLFKVIDIWELHDLW